MSLLQLFVNKSNLKFLTALSLMQSTYPESFYMQQSGRRISLLWTIKWLNFLKSTYGKHVSLTRTRQVFWGKWKKNIQHLNILHRVNNDKIFTGGTAVMQGHYHVFQGFRIIYSSIFLVKWYLIWSYKRFLDTNRGLVFTVWF